MPYAPRDIHRNAMAKYYADASEMLEKDPELPLKLMKADDEFNSSYWLSAKGLRKPGDDSYYTEESIGPGEVLSLTAWYDDISNEEEISASVVDADCADPAKVSNSPREYICCGGEADVVTIMVSYKQLREIGLGKALDVADLIDQGIYLRST